MKVLNFGSINIDYLYELEHFVQPGETIHSRALHKNSGGKGMNQSVALAKAGVAVYHAGMIGEQDQEFLLGLFRQYGVRTDYIQAVPTPTGHAIIQVTDTGENSIILYGGANQQIGPSYVEEVLSQFGPGDFCILQNEISCLRLILEKAHERGMRIVLNPSPFQQELMTYPLQYVEYFLLNEVEGFQMTGERQPDRILQALKKDFPQGKFVLTLGKQGVLYGDPQQQCSFGIFDIPVVDTTAAGDTFTGYFIYGVLQGLPVPDTLRLASAASSLTVSRQGAAQSIPYRQEVEEFLNR